MDVMKSGIDCYMSKGTANALGIQNNHRCQMVDKNIQFDVGDFTVLPVPIQHDAADPLAFLIQYRPTGEKLLYATDTFYLKNRFRNLQYLMIECNYCLDILKANIESGLIPEMLKNRLLESHFSLDNVKGFMKANDLSQVRQIVLIHLSEGNSDAARMQREIRELTGKETVVAMPGMEIPLEQFPF